MYFGFPARVNVRSSGLKDMKRAKNGFKMAQGPEEDEVPSRESANPRLAVGVLAFSFGCLWVAVDSLSWYSSQQALAIHDQQYILGLVLRFYAAEALALCVLGAGAFMIYSGLVAGKGGSELDSVRAILGDALESGRDFKIGVAAAVIYCLVYLVVSSMLVFQPTVDFASTYGVTASSWNAAGCCGSAGTVPALIVYIAPQAHLAFQILPLDLLFAVVVPLLVGLNVTVASHAVRNKDVRTNVGWIGSLGVLAGLFTGCPTCAGLFLASAAGGLGATTLAIALAPYQILFVIVSIPVLAVSPIVIALNAKRAMRAACPVPTEPRGRSSEGAEAEPAALR